MTKTKESPAIAFDAKHFTRVNGVFITEASDLALPAGVWPKAFILEGLYVPGDRTPFEKVGEKRNDEGELMYVEYRDPKHGLDPARIYND